MANERLTFTMTFETAKLIHELVADRLAARKNHLVTKVENRKFDEAEEMTKEIRLYQDLFADFNVAVKADTDRLGGTIHVR